MNSYSGTGKNEIIKYQFKAINAFGYLKSQRQIEYFYVMVEWCEYKAEFSVVNYAFRCTHVHTSVVFFSSFSSPPSKFKDFHLLPIKNH